MHKRFPRIFVLLCLFFLVSCTFDPLYKTNPSLYRAYKYWDVGSDAWYKSGQFDVIAQRNKGEKAFTLKLTAHLDGLPSTALGHVEAAETVAYALISRGCGLQAYELLSAKVPEGGAWVDRYFYRNDDLSLGVDFKCSKEHPGQSRALAEKHMWTLASTHFFDEDGVKVKVDVFPVAIEGLHLIRTHIFTVPVDPTLGRIAAVNTMQKRCSGKRIVPEFVQKGLDIGREDGVLYDPAVLIFGFSCKE